MNIFLSALPIATATPVLELNPAATNLRRSFLESQLALPTAIRTPFFQDEVFAFDLDSAGALCEFNHSPTKVVQWSKVVVKGLASEVSSARKKRLDARKKKLEASGRQVASQLVKITPPKRKGKLTAPKPESVQDYLSTFLKDIGRMKLLTQEDEVELSKKMKELSALTEGKQKLERELGYQLTTEEWASHLGMTVSDLARVMEKGALAKDMMVLANLRLVVSIAKRYSKHGLELPDLIQAGTTGLMRGVEKFDHTRGYKLSTYVHWWIRQAVTRAIAEHSRVVRLPVHVHDSMTQILRAKYKLVADGSPETLENLSKSLGISDRKIQGVMQVNKLVKSLDASPRWNGAKDGTAPTFHHFVEDPNENVYPWTIVEAKVMTDEINRLLHSVLNERERDIVKLHHGLGCPDGVPLTLDAIGSIHGISRERVRQVEAAAMRKLKKPGRKMELQRYCD
eukprot:TRINITY_DN21695_c0_g1_i1.p1 TRINITY_DN21695_c0_g1~~TRINITY_DN21695_c0_g1_i1.p1  ORF type:complete len:454 (+),score=89.05 TRINITY_DN21695_c0_g1_i1:232-1593(+)